jgi:hypothetical protein
VLAVGDFGGAFERIATAIQRREAPRPAATAPAVTAMTRRASPVTVLTGIALAAGGALGLVLSLRVRRSRPPIAAGLRDLGSHTSHDYHPLRRRVTRIGRGAGNDIVIARDTVSAEHAVVAFRDGLFMLRDLRSANGTFLDGKRFSDPDAIREVSLKHGNRVRIDAYEFEFIVEELAGRADGDRPTDRSVERTALRAPAATDPAPEQETRGPGPHQAEPRTLVKPDACPAHPEWRATELCPRCKRGVCRFCMSLFPGAGMCAECVRATGPTGVSQ